MGGLLVGDSLESLCCVLDQDTLSTALYWFNPGRQEIVPTWLKTVDCDVKHLQTNSDGTAITISVNTGPTAPLGAAEQAYLELCCLNLKLVTA